VTLSGRLVLDGAALDVARGELVAILAPSGAGKSTLLRACVRLVELDAGEILLDGAEVRSLDPCALRRRVALVAQHPVMLPGTVRDNLSHGIADLSDADARSALAAAGLDAGLIGRTARELSGGERARVAVARALTRAPELLLLDEPTAALDQEASEHLGATLARLRRSGLGVAVATHDLAFAEANADRVVSTQAFG
jgi:ABC-type multidrug transport system fused ATPase/permease subunit